MTGRAGHGWTLAVAVVCAVVAALHQPRPAIGAAVTAAAVAIGGARRLALLACVAAAVALIAVTPPTSHSRPVNAVSEHR